MANIHVDDSVMEALASLANAQGQSVEDFLRGLVLGKSATAPPEDALEILRRIKAASVNSESTYRGTYPREEIYREHD